LLDLLLRAIERINEDIDALSKAAFLAETKAGRQLRDAVVLNLGTMGEIAEDIRKQHPDFAACHAQIPFKRIWDMRCHLFHGYHSVDYEVVWTTCRAAVPELERQIRAAVAGLDDT
jgi:uncharacterized protein with HEPN domain